jgi:6-pyruvoyltetrahydropterin/6-carboxytetrahydropterin synthase
MTVLLTRRYGFAASHRLYCEHLTEQQNRDTFGKCANPFGHGHNYEVEVTVSGEVDPVTGRAVDIAVLDNLADEQILKPFRHRDLNREVPAFATAVPTTENLAIEVDRRLRMSWTGAFPANQPRLEKVRIRETARNICDI